METEVVDILVRTNIAASLTILLVLAIRTPVRRLFGASAAYGLWVAAPLAALSTQLPFAGRFGMASHTVGLPMRLWSGLDAAAALPLPPVIASLLAVTWLVGMAAAVSVLIWRQRALALSIGRTVEFDRDVVVAESVLVGPALVGFFRPRIVLPYDFSQRFDTEEQALVLAHERAHMRCGDAVINAAVAAIQCLAWFNPIIHQAARDLKIDQELACDERVTAQFPNLRRKYAEAIVKSQVTTPPFALASHMASRGLAPLRTRLVALKRRPPGVRRASIGVLAVTVVTLASGGVASALQSGPVRGVSTTILQLTVGRGVVVRSSDHHFMCANDARCEFDAPAHSRMTLLGKSLTAIQWRGCSNTPHPNRCDVEIGEDSARVISAQ